MLLLYQLKYGRSKLGTELGSQIAPRVPITSGRGYPDNQNPWSRPCQQCCCIQRMKVIMNTFCHLIYYCDVVCELQLRSNYKWDSWKLCIQYHAQIMLQQFHHECGYSLEYSSIQWMWSMLKWNICSFLFLDVITISNY